MLQPRKDPLFWYLQIAMLLFALGMVGFMTYQIRVKGMSGGFLAIMGISDPASPAK